jgi:hypothetical protein
MASDETAVRFLSGCPKKPTSNPRRWESVPPRQTAAAPHKCHRSDDSARLTPCPETNSIFPVTYSRSSSRPKMFTLGPSSRNSTRPFFATLFTGSGERRRQMRRQSAGTYAFKYALLFLAFAVFSWGLQAKLSLYKPRQSPSTVRVAKLLTERRSVQTMALLEKVLKPDTTRETLNLIPLLVLAQAILILTFGFYQVEMNPCRSRRRDFRDPHLTQRPPPTFC